MATPSTPATPPTPPPQPPPAAPRGWNWGAFWLNWIWAIGNRVWIGLLTLVPLVGLVMPFVLGAKGNQWAWQAKPWRDEAHFRQTQRNWSIAGWIVAAVSVLVAIALVLFVFKATSAPVDVSRQFVADLQANRVDQAYAATSPAFKSVTPKEKLGEIAQLQRQVSTGQFNVRERYVENASARVAGVLKAKAGDDLSVQVNLVSEDDRWLVQGYNFRR